jgi:hypothetical protein
MKVCFNGCSFTVGDGFPVNHRDKFIYDRIISKKFNFESDNIAVGGSSNYKIFMRSADAIISNKYDLVVTQWSALHRIWLHPGPDANFFVNDTQHPDFKYRDLYLTKSQKKTFANTLLLMNHDYQNIIDLVDYCCFLKHMAGKTKLIFINGLLPWTKDLATPLGTDLSNSLSKYTKTILDFDNRSDSETVEFFKKLQHKFAELDSSLWINLFDSFSANSVDVGPLGHHPGPESHKWMANQLENYLTTQYS